MSQAGITLLIIAGLCVLYILDKLPVALVTTIGMLALVFSGGLTFSEAFSCFGSTPVVLTFGMVIIINAIIESGMITEFETILLKMTRRGEKLFLVQILVTAGIISMFTNNTALVAMFMPFIASVAKASRGRIQKKHLYMPLAIGGLIGGTGTLAGSTAPLLASNVLEITGEEPFSFFTTAPVALIILAAVALCYWFFLYDLQVKWFDFPEVDNDVAEEREEELFETKESLDLEGGLAIKEALDGRTVMPVNKKHGIISICVFLLCVVGFIVRPFEWDLGQIACAGAVIVMLTGCVDTRKELRNMMWPALITLGAALAIAQGFVVTGAGQVIIDWLIDTFGPLMTDPKVMVAVFLVAGWVISNFMSNGSLVSMLAAVAVPMAIGAGVNPTPVAIACAIGASMAFATPVATTTITMVQVAGYRFKDYFRIGGVVGAVGVTVAWLAIVSIYGLW
jgi:di/tricarboxylate transporter